MFTISFVYPFCKRYSENSIRSRSKVQCTNFLNSQKIFGKAYVSFFTERVEYRDENNNFIKRTYFTEDTTFTERLYYSVFRIFERLDNSYLFAQTVKIPKDIDYFENESINGIQIKNGSYIMQKKLEL